MLQLSTAQRKRGKDVSVNNQHDNQRANNAEISPIDDTFFTVAEVAKFLKVHHTTVYRLVKRHEMPAFKIGSDWRFSKKAIEKWVVAIQRKSQ